MGAFGAFLLVLLYGRMTLDLLKHALYRTALTSSMILVLVAASNFFGAVFSRLGAPSFIADSLVLFDLPSRLGAGLGFNRSDDDIGTGDDAGLAVPVAVGPAWRRSPG